MAADGPDVLDFGSWRLELIPMEERRPEACYLIFKQFAWNGHAQLPSIACCDTPSRCPLNQSAPANSSTTANRSPFEAHIRLSTSDSGPKRLHADHTAARTTQSAPILCNIPPPPSHASSAVRAITATPAQRCSPASLPPRPPPPRAALRAAPSRSGSVGIRDTAAVR